MCSFLVWKKSCLNNREFDLEGDLVGVPHTWYLSAQSFIRLLKPVWREYDIVAMNEWKKKLKNAALCIPAWLKGAILDVKLQLFRFNK